VVRQLLRKLARQGDVFQVVKDLFYTAANMDELARIIKELACATPNGEVVAREFRDATGLGRKRAIQIIECFDRLGYTRRVRDAHVLRPDAQWHSHVQKA
jgi:selenocysteine-specific elongation factor